MAKRVHSINCVYRGDNSWTYEQKKTIKAGDIIHFTFSGFPVNDPITVVVQNLDITHSYSCQGCPIAYKSILGFNCCKARRHLNSRYGDRPICTKGNAWYRSFKFVDVNALLEDL